MTFPLLSLPDWSPVSGMADDSRAAMRMGK